MSSDNENDEIEKYEKDYIEKMHLDDFSSDDEVYIKKYHVIGSRKYNR